MSNKTSSPSLKGHLLVGSIIGLTAGIVLIRGLENSLGSGFHLTHYGEAFLGIFPGLILGGLSYLVHRLVSRRFIGADEPGPEG